MRLTMTHEAHLGISPHWYMAIVGEQLPLSVQGGVTSAAPPASAGGEPLSLARSGADAAGSASGGSAPHENGVGSAAKGATLCASAGGWLLVGSGWLGFAPEVSGARGIAPHEYMPVGSR